MSNLPSASAVNLRRADRQRRRWSASAAPSVAPNAESVAFASLERERAAPRSRLKSGMHVDQTIAMDGTAFGAQILEFAPRQIRPVSWETVQRARGATREEIEDSSFPNRSGPRHCNLVRLPLEAERVNESAVRGQRILARLQVIPSRPENCGRRNEPQPACRLLLHASLQNSDTVSSGHRRPCAIESPRPADDLSSLVRPLTRRETRNSQRV